VHLQNDIVTKGGAYGSFFAAQAASRDVIGVTGKVLDAARADPIGAGLASLRDPSPDGVARREAMRCAIELKNAEFNVQGIELNQRYQSGAAVPDLDAGEEI
jgi:hypothetical protein